MTKQTQQGDGKSYHNPNTQKPAGRAIVTYGRSFQALAAAQCLGRYGVEVIACDEAPLMAASFSRYVTDNFVHSSGFEDVDRFLDEFESRIEEFKPQDDRPYVLIPIDRYTLLFSIHRERFEGKINIAAPKLEAIRQVMPKHHLTQTCGKLDIPIPSTRVVSDKFQLEEASESIGFPAFVKLSNSSGGVGVYRLESKTDLDAAYKDLVEKHDLNEKHPAVLQEFVEGDDYCVGVLMQHGRLRAGMAYRNVKTYPFAGGSGTVRETVEASKLLEITRRLLGPLDWHGVAEIDFRWTGNDDDEPILIEVNPRFWGGLFQSIESGIDFPWLLFQMVTTDKIDDPGEVIIGTRTRVPFFSTISAIIDIENDLFETLKEQSRQGWESIKSGSVWSGIQLISSALVDALSPVERLELLEDYLKDNAEARREIIETEDPISMLGILYIFGSLIKTGHLPKELSRGPRREVDVPPKQ